MSDKLLGAIQVGVLFFSFLFSSCGEIENEYSKHQAFLYFNNADHLDQTLAAALNPSTTNIFCRVYLKSANTLGFENNQGGSSSTPLTAREKQRPLVLGINNAYGIIMGYGFGGTFYCYDALCANCYNNGKSYNRLSMNTAGIATCSKCGRQYDLTNNGLCPQGGRLERYYATTTGPNGTVTVNNNGR